MSKWPRRDRNAKNYGEMGSNPYRKANGKKRGQKAGKQRRVKRLS